MRRGFDSLSGLVTVQLQMNALNGAVFIFFNKQCNRVKLLVWEGDGFAMYYKRLEKGTYELPVMNDNNSSASIPVRQLQWILQGLSLKSVCIRKRYQHAGESC